MKVSELIKQLEDLAKEHGDVPVALHDFEWGWLEVGEVEVSRGHLRIYPSDE